MASSSNPSASLSTPALPRSSTEVKNVIKRPRAWAETKKYIDDTCERLRDRLILIVRAGDLQACEAILSEAEALISEVALEGFVSSKHIRNLIVHGTDIDDPITCLQYAIGGRNEELVLRLIEFGAKLPKPGLVGWDLLLGLVVDFSMFRIAELLFVDANQKLKNENLLAFSSKGMVGLVDIYLKNGAQVDWQDRDDQTALFIAVKNKDLALAKALLEAGARLDLTKRNGRTVYELALRKHDDEMARLILDQYRKESGTPNTANMNLDLKVHRHDILGALDLLETGSSVSLRMTSSVLLPEEEPIVGNQNEYLKTLCSNINKFEMSSGSGNVATTQDTSSDQHYLHASRCLLDCLTKHVNCIRAEGPLPRLPTRVIDVGYLDLPNVVLLATNQMKGRYVALSHRWGNSDIRKTTRSNLESRLNGMSFSDLTKTMQDAVIITRNLGVRYLWIDAICIIQDSHSDWSDEASRMADVYKNSLFTISASASADHSQGCFASSKGRGPGGDLSSRGWVLQEELLSPRILEYGFGLTKWECITCIPSLDQGNDIHNIRDSHPVPAEQGRLKRALWGFRSTSMSLKRQAHASWQQMVMSYSRRTLTNDSDKLMAISGISTFVQRTLEDVFLAGLWQNHLYQDLLWTSNCDAAARISSTALPSWSWASIAGSVSYSRWPAGSTPAYLKSMLEQVDANLEESANGPICQKLVITGNLLKVSRGVLENRHLLYSSVREKSVEERGREVDKPENQLPPPPPPQLPDPQFSEDSSKTGWFWNKLGLGSRTTLAANSASSTELVDEPSKGTDAMPAKVAGLDPSQYDDDDRDFHAKMQKTRKDSTQMWIDIKCEEFEEAWLFPVASEHFWTHCLVLVPVDIEEKKKGKAQEQMRKFRRVAKCHVDNVYSLDFFLKQERVEFELV